MRLLRLAAITLVAITVIGACRADDFHFNSIRRYTRTQGWAVGGGRNYKWPSTVKSTIRFDTVRYRIGTFITPKQENILDVGIGLGTGSWGNRLYTATYTNRRYFAMKENSAWSIGLGAGFTNFQHTIPDLATTLNFTTLLELAYHQAVSSDSAMSLEYVFSHTSNGDTHKPNTGINISTLLLGYSTFK